LGCELTLDDRETTKRQRERATALASLQKVEACIARGAADRSEQLVPDWAADCTEELAAPFANIFIETNVDPSTANLATVRLGPSFMFPNKWISPFYL